MATRRMFSKNIIESARFLRMPISSQALYFHLGIKADDDGVVEAYTVLRMTGATEDDLRVLSAKGLIVVLNEDLVTFITDWNEHNKIRPDRKIDSMYKDLLVQVLPDVDLIEKRIRADVKKLDNQWTTNGQPMDGIGKDRIGKVSSGKENTSNKPSSAQLTEWFEKVWSYYPRKEGKAKANKVFVKEVGAAKDPEAMYKHIGKSVYNYAEMMKKEERERTKIKTGGVFFNNKSWEDEDIMNYQRPKKKVEEQMSVEEALRQKGGL